MIMDPNHLLPSQIISFLLGWLLVLTSFSCTQHTFEAPSDEFLHAMGKDIRKSFANSANSFKARIKADSSDLKAWLGYAEMNVFLFIFGLSSRESTIPLARNAVQFANHLDSNAVGVHTLNGIMSFLDWNWMGAKSSFERAIRADPGDPKPRHWYSLWLVSMQGDFETAMRQSDTIVTLDPSGDYQIGRGSLLYFARENERLKDLMKKTIAKDPAVPWGYDWLGMAHIELKEYEESIDIYQQAFRLSDGLVEVGGGLGHALGLAGAHAPAKKMASYYAEAAKSHYLPAVQRAFIHIGIGENDEAISLLQQAYDEKSWFIIFIQIEPWYDPIRKDPRFLELVERMNFPVKLLQKI